MTRNPSKSSNSDDSWEQLEADLFGVEVGKEYTANERVASVPSPEVDDAPEAPLIIAKPIEEDDFGDFGAGLVEATQVAPKRSSTPKPPARTKPPKAAEPVAAPVVAPIVAKVAPPPPPSDLDFDLEDGLTDEDLDAAAETDEADEEAQPASPDDDPYWDALANWNWQEDDRAGKPRADAGRDRSRSPSRSDSGGPRRGPSDRGAGERSDRGRSGHSDRRPAPPQPRESRPSVPDERPHTPARRSPVDRDRGRVEDAAAPVDESPVIEQELVQDHADSSAGTPEVKSRRQDRRRSRRHSPAQPTQSPEEAGFGDDHAEETLDDGWPAGEPTSRESSVDQPRSRDAQPVDLDEDFEDESGEAEERAPAGVDEEGAPRRRRSRRRRRRPDRPATAKTEAPADEDIKELDEDPFVSEDDDELTSEGGSEVVSGDEEGSETDRPGRTRRPRRRRRGGRTERPAPAPVERAESEFEDDDEVLDAESDDPFEEDRDREFVEEDEPPRPRRRSRSGRPATVRVIHEDEDEDEQDEDDGEPEPEVSYEDVPSWEEAISYLLNPSLVEGAPAAGERSGPVNEQPRGADRGPRSGGERGPRPPRRGPRRDA